MMALTVLGYVTLAVFAGAVLWRIVHFANNPVHLRWELYPVPHEPPEKASHAGSYLEDVDWWDKPHEVDHVNEIVEMLQEMLLIKALWHSQRKLWFVSFPFHLGLYSLMGLVGLLLLSGLVQAFGLGVAPDDTALATVVGVFTGVLGFMGFGVGIVGACGLLLRRLSDPELKDFTSTLDYFNLFAFVVLFGVGLALMATDPRGVALHSFTGAMFTFSPAPDLPMLAIVAIVMASVMVMYIPMTHMSHFVAKYFTWHSVRWNDEALLPGNKIDKAIGEQLGYPVHWSAPHIGGDGTRTWADVCTTDPTKETGE